ncbi:30S ribosomal protein S1 [Fusobacterium hominis]|jgi:small subunit ribosomal protein S1|uniref:30S ribosomal protein S1 n=1 Tax=Fusobacterium hominis TaxID=2764326 RepID=UPI0021073D07|nr:30S ribosomal protein S1 [Fusobacterium hominis]
MHNNENYDEFKTLLEDYLPEENTNKVRVKGKIDQKDRTYSYLDVPGQPTTVRVKTEELENYEVGDEVEILLLGQNDSEEDNFIIGSRKRIDMEDNLKEIQDAFKNKEVLKGKILRKVKGGYILSVLSHQGFLPNSLSEIPMKDGDKMVGKEVNVMVKDMQKDKRGGDKITFSRKEITVQKQQEEFDELAVGDVVDAEITDVLDFGLSVKIRHLRGFIHISEVSWKKLDKLTDHFKKKDTVKAKIIVLEPEKTNIKLSIKALTRNPWEVVAETVGVDSEVKGKVTKLLPYGAFVEIADGVEGLVHMSDFAWNKKRVNLGDYIKVGDEIQVRVLEFNPESRRLKLGIKQLCENPWDTAEERYAVGKALKAKVVEVKDFGLFAEIEPGVDVFIHNSDYNWQGEENKKFSVGDEIEFKVIELNTDENKIKGSIKAMTKSPWERAMESYKLGQTVEKKIKNILDFGMFVSLCDGVDGFIPAQLASKDFIKNLKDRFAVGDVVKAQIVEIDKEKERIKLSIKKIELEEEKRENQELLNKYGTSSTNE